MKLGNLLDMLGGDSAEQLPPEEAEYEVHIIDDDGRKLNVINAFLDHGDQRLVIDAVITP